MLVALLIRCCYFEAWLFLGCAEPGQPKVLADPTAWRQDSEPEQLRALIQVCRSDLPNADVVIHLAFRGTVNQENLVTDLYAELVPWDFGDAVISAARVHRGFQDAYRALRSGVLGRLDADLAKFNVAASRVLLRATGHSLGGALAKVFQRCGLSLSALQAWTYQHVEVSLLDRADTARFDLVPRLPAHSDDEAVASRGRRRTPMDVLRDVRLFPVASMTRASMQLLRTDLRHADLYKISVPAAPVREWLPVIRSSFAEAFAMEEISNAAHALLPHQLDAYEEKLEFFLRDQVSAGTIVPAHRRPWCGVNLGGWLLLEPGPSAPLFPGEPQLRCEWSLMESLRSRQALHVLHRHRETFIRKEDFRAIRDMGLNSVRVPFGYWVVLGPGAGEPYVGPALDILDRAVEWAEEYNLEVLLDLHGCPGGESPDAPCGRRQRPESKWAWQQWRRLETLKALEVVAQRYSGRKSVTGIAVCNEPSRLIPADILARFYDEAVDVIRKAGMTDRGGPKVGAMTAEDADMEDAGAGTRERSRTPPPEGKGKDPEVEVEETRRKRPRKGKAPNERSPEEQEEMARMEAEWAAETAKKRAAAEAAAKRLMASKRYDPPLFRDADGDLANEFWVELPHARGRMSLVAEDDLHEVRSESTNHKDVSGLHRRSEGSQFLFDDRSFSGRHSHLSLERPVRRAEVVDRATESGFELQVTVVLPVFQRCLRTFEAVWRQVSRGRHSNTCFDVHYYHCFEDTWNRMTLAEHLRAVEDHGRELQEFPAVVGEWSLALGGRAASAMCPKEAMNLFGRAQLQAYSKASRGWFFWNWRDGAGPAWAECLSRLYEVLTPNNGD
ncbi:Glucan 1,3-beta-glucosidase A [Symbiodinium microadriaticum]|uniref:glucan 1,3-beta-glucosidase n=1 Tax=Symbiodinium microadriaticum TaxID=2951 RepID=A0A1Q9D302_SYMMI|nr:Glucan 1,3-beta-glucosidase A [Symbiodinium microadriaticum]